ncbi:CU044_5270 family protein [Jatrophihabitans endophyticus]|uniref:CU044_5270 family protein n=1 Tax=Jatrophihabitans endophyticus TaxID=1206085 RepID=UPI0019FDD083|nr:CU044_5270 family protein [Jatrophihabitans endophyticus]MBE7189736.1 CU044_5270 family protein [Jatrophihabitans endophyticus]
MNDDTNDLERRLTDALGHAGEQLTDSAPPTFSWQEPGGTATSRTRRRAIYAGSGLVAAAVAAAVVATTLPGGTSTAGHPQAAGTTTAGTAAAPARSHGTTAPARHESAPKLLLAAAHLQMTDGDPALTDGQFRYVRIVSPAPALYTYKGNKPHTVPAPAGSYTLDQYWIPKDETDVWMRRQSVVGDPNGGAPDVWKGRCDDLYADTQDGPKGAPCTRPGSFDDPTPAFVAGLPRDPDALYSQLHAYSEKHLNPEKIDDVNFEMFSTVDSLLQDGIVTSDLTSTLYSVLSKIPGISVVDGATNYSGVAGTGFRISTKFGHTLADTSMIIVDLDSGAYLGDRDDSKGNHYSSAVTTGVSDGLGQPGH